MNLEQLEKKFRELDEQYNSNCDPDKPKNLEEIFKQAELSTYTGTQSALMSAVGSRDKAIQQQKIQDLKKVIEKKGTVRCVLAGLYNTKILTKPEINQNPKVNTFGLVNDVLQECVNRTQKRIENLQKQVYSLETEYKETCNKCEDYEILINEVIEFYKSMPVEECPDQEQTKAKEKPEQAEKFRRLARRLKDNYYCASNNKQIYEDMISFGKDKLHQAEFELGMIKETLKKLQEPPPRLPPIRDFNDIQKYHEKVFTNIFKNLNNFYTPQTKNSKISSFTKGTIPIIKTYDQCEKEKTEDIIKKLKSVVEPNEVLK